MEDTLINFGSEMKVLGETADAWQVGGWAVVFNSHDASSLRDKFLKSTDYDIEDGETRSLYYNHGLDGTIKKTKLGRCTVELKDAGIWYEAEVKKRTDYLKAHAAKIIEGVKAGIYGTSTGAPSHLVERKSVDGGHEVTLWPISEISITPTPAEPLTTCISLKSLQEIEDADELKAKQSGWITANGTHILLGSETHRNILGGKDSGKPSDTEVLKAMDRHGVADKKAREAILDAHSKGHIQNTEQLHAILKHTTGNGEHGGSEGHAVTGVNAFGGGDGRFQTGGDKPDGKPDDAKPDDKEDKPDDDTSARLDHVEAGLKELKKGKGDHGSNKAAAGTVATKLKNMAAKTKGKLSDSLHKAADRLAGAISGSPAALLGAIGEAQDVIKEAKAGYEKGKAAGDAAAGKSVDISTETKELLTEQRLDQLTKDAPRCPDCNTILVRGDCPTCHPELTSDAAQSKESKSTHNFTTPQEVVQATEAILRTSMPLGWQAEAVRTAVNGLTARVEALSSVKAGRVISATNHDELSTVYAALMAACERLGSLVEAHKPESEKSIELDVLEMELRYLEQHSLAAMAV